MKEAASWLAERLAGERDRFFRVGPAPLAPRPERKLAAAGSRAARGDAAPARRAAAAGLARAHGTRFPPVSQFLERFRAVLRRRRRFDFDAEVGTLSRVDQAVAFLALLELRRTEARSCLPHPRTVRRAEPGSADADALAPDHSAFSAPQEPRTKGPRRMDRPLRLITANPVDQLARTVEALLVVASAPLSRRGARAGGGRRRRAGRARARAALGSLSRGPERDRPRARRGWLRVPRLARGRGGLRAPVRAAGRARALAGRARDARDRRLPRPVQPAGDRPDPRRRRRLGRRRPARAGLIAEAGREDSPGGAVRYRTTPLFERVFGLESVAALPRLDDLGESAAEIRERLHSVAVGKTA